MHIKETKTINGLTPNEYVDELLLKGKSISLNELKSIISLCYDYYCDNLHLHFAQTGPSHFVESTRVEDYGKFKLLLSKIKEE